MDHAPFNETDNIYPVHGLDDTKTFRSILMTWTISFNDRLDVGKLHSSLSKFLDVDDWRKIGSRLASTVCLWLPWFEERD